MVAIRLRKALCRRGRFALLTVADHRGLLLTIAGWFSRGCALGARARQAGRLHHTTDLPRVRRGWCETRPALVRRVTRTRARPKSADAASAANSPPSDSRRQRGEPGPHYR